MMLKFAKQFKFIIKLLLIICIITALKLSITLQRAIAKDSVAQKDLIQPKLEQITTEKPGASNHIEKDIPGINNEKEIEKSSQELVTSKQNLTSSQKNCQSFEQILASLQNNLPQVYVIDLTQEQLDQEKLRQLKAAIDNNSVIGYIYWGEMPIDCEDIKGQIEDKLIKNICDYNYYPNDYFHGLLANHVYSNPKLNQKLDLAVLSQQLGHKLPASTYTCWKVAQVKDDSKNTGYYSALYINETTHQAVLAFQGTKMEGLQDLLRKKSDLQEDIDSILGNVITEQNALAYVATKNAVDYAKERGFNLSITGHSLGGYLAELGVAFCYRDFGYRQVKGIVFDSPGTHNKLDKFSANVINKATKFSIAKLPIVTYLSVPNLINACNRHPGEVYRVYPQLEWSAELAKWAKRAGNLPVIGSSVKSADKVFLALTGHSLATILRLFDPTTGKPQTCVRVTDWPKIDTDKLAYIGKKKQELESISVLKLGASILTGNTTLIGGAFQILPHLIGGTTASIFTVIKDFLNINQAQYWATLAYLDDNYKETTLSTQNEFTLRYEGHYQVSERGMNEHILYTENYEGVDWYLYELYKVKSKLEQCPTKDITVAVLKNILQDYEVVSLDERPYVRLVQSTGYIDPLRDKMRRSINVLSANGINKAIEDSNIYALAKQLEANSIQQLNQVHNYIAQAKLKDHVTREHKQQELTKKLEEAKVCVVSGPEGVGKSTLVAEYGHQEKGQNVVWWLPAGSRTKLLRSYENIAQALGFDYHQLAQEPNQDPNQYLSKLVEAVYKAFVNYNQPALLILDNAEDSALVDICLSQKSPLIKVIIITKNDKEFSNYKQVKLDNFTSEQGKKYIQQSLEPSKCQPSNQDIQALIKEVGLVPQKLALAVSYIKQNKLQTIKEYTTKLQSLKKKGIKAPTNLILPQVSLSLQTLRPCSQQLMLYAAYLDTDFIPLSLVSDLIQTGEQGTLETVLSELEGLSLITILKGKNHQLGIQVHREIQAACKEYQSWIGESNLSDKKLILSLLQVLHKHMPKVTNIPNDKWKQAALYAANVAHVLSGPAKVLGPQLSVAKLLSRLGNYNEQVVCNFQQALNYYQKALEMYQALYTSNHPRIGKALNNVGSAYQALGNSQETLKYYEKALHIYQASCLGNHPNIAISLNNVGRAYQSLGKFQEALNYLKQALQMQQVLYTGNQDELATTLNNTGSVYQALGNFQEALKYYLQGLEMKQALYTGNHPHIAASLNNVGSVYQALGNFQEALKYYEQGLKMKQELYKGNHPAIAISLNNVGRAYQALGNFQEALNYLKQSLEMKQKLYTGNHPYIIIALNNVGSVYQALGNFQEALKYYEQALKMAQTLYTGNHPDIATSLNNMGHIYQILGNFQEASKYYTQALKMFQALYVRDPQ